MSDDKASMHALEPAGDMLAELLDGKTTPVAVAVATRCRARIEVQDLEVMAWQALD